MPGMRRGTQLNASFAHACPLCTQAREKQMARLLREDELGACQLELANGRMLRLAQTR